ncbi:DUF3817 domain-containing protein [Jannaschia sp. Os4]|uniref:DUF3817 domain-containing protein n=1 Tax=Jannaschia sp. Os4 TaxID=2807617 RepID=UPI00193AB8CE|nr:DUF3817 domain-containing protein [Jannaschia sp. Os4]MBM2577964.1 DUF3817 domain-containing protein [Jannaschia sp. Os4]
MTGLGELRLATLAEGATLILLMAVAVPLKHLAGWPVGTQVMGPVHGAAFLLFAWMVIRSWAEGIVGGGGAARLIAGAFVPFAGLWNERWLRRMAEGAA